MRDPERTGAPYRPGNSPASLNDLRWVYKKLLEIEARLAQLQAMQSRLNSRVAEDRRYLGAITDNTNQLIDLIVRTEERLQEAQQALRKKCTDQVQPSRSLPGTGRTRYRRRRGTRRQGGTE